METRALGTTKKMAMVQHDGDKKTLSNGVARPAEGVSEEIVQEAAENAREGDKPAEENVAGEPPQKRQQYSKAELLRLRHQGRQRPTCLDPVYNNLSGMWDPERWFLGKRRGSTPPTAEVTETARGKRERLDSESDVPQSGPGQGSKRRSGDPRERVSREEEIVLSPQRRSFGTGCHVSQPSPLAGGRHTSLDGGSKDADGGGSLLLHGGGGHGSERGRRIGSGRILRDQGPQPSWGDRDYGYGTSRRFDDGPSFRNDRRRGGGREEARPFPDLEEAPEWFLGGPSSQHETIELVGFEEDIQPEGGPKQRGGRRARRSREVARQRMQTPAEAPTDSSADAPTEGKTECSVAPSQEKAVEKQADIHEEAPPLAPGSPPAATAPQATPTPPPVVQEGFDFNDLFKPDWCPRIFSETSSGGTEKVGSRFSQWFRWESPPPPPVEEGCSDVGSRTGLLCSPPSAEAYFTPISPALPQERTSSPREKSILDILLDANIRVEPHLINGDAAKHVLWAKAKNVAELEADLKETVLGSQAGSRARLEEGDRQQLEGLLGRLQGTRQQHQVVEQPGNQHLGAELQSAQKQDVRQQSTWQPSTLLQQQNQSGQQQASQFLGRGSHGRDASSLQTSYQPPLLAHLLQPPAAPKPTGHSSDVLARILGASDGSTSPLPHSRPPPYSMVGATAPGMLLKQPMPLLTTQRPSPTQQLDALLAGAPAMAGPSLGVSLRQSPLPDSHRVPSPLAMFGAHTSPIHQGGSANTLQVHSPAHGVRVPSPQELAVHTQSILQTALLKKILEEQKQKENLRKQQEARRMQSPSKGTSPTMAAFTPTSVMRKMHLERSEQPKCPPPAAHGGGAGGDKREPSPANGTVNGTTAGQPGGAASGPTGGLGQENGARHSRGSIGRPIMKAGAKGDQKIFPQGTGLLRPSEVDVVAKLLDQQRLLGTAAPATASAGVAGLPPLMRSAVPPPRPVGPSMKRAPPPLELLQQALAHGLHPLTFQQLLVAQQQHVAAAQHMAQQHMAQQHVAQQHMSQQHLGQQHVAQQHVSHQHVNQQHMGHQHLGHPSVNQQYGATSHLHPPHPNLPAGVHRGQAVGRASASPVNLAKWFGSEVLGQQQSPLPPVPHQKALLLEEVERQQQQPTAVKN